METPPKVSQLLVVDDERRLASGALHCTIFRAKVMTPGRPDSRAACAAFGPATSMVC
jgi:hypothetical protein